MATQKDDLHYFGKKFILRRKSTISLCGEISYIDGEFPIYVLELEARLVLGIARRFKKYFDGIRIIG